METNFSDQILSLLKDYFFPLKTSFESPESALSFFKDELGWNLDALIAPADQHLLSDLIAELILIPDKIEQISTLASDHSIAGFVKLLGESHIDVLFNDIKGIKDIQINPEAVINAIKIEDLLIDLFNWLTITYLGTYQLNVYNVLNLLQVINTTRAIETKTDTNNVVLRHDGYVPSIHLDRLVKIIKQNDVTQLISFDTVADINLIIPAIIEPVMNLINSLGCFTVYGAGEIPAQLDDSESRYDNLLYSEKYWTQNNAIEKVSLTVGFLLNSEGGPGIFVNPEGATTFTYNKSGWSISADAVIDVPFKINRIGISPIATTIVKPSININGSYQPQFAANGKAFQFGKSTESNISIQTVKASLYGKFDDNLVSYGISVEIVDFDMTIKIDNAFIKAIIPDDAHVKFNFEIGYSSLNGFHFGGSGGLDIKLAQNISIGPVNLKDTRLSLKPKDTTQGGNSGFDILIGTNISALVGPLGLTIEEIGLKADIGFPPDATGNLGLVNLLPGIKFPTGIGITLDTEVLKADGFLRINEEKGEYIGAVAIFIKSIELRVAAVGIINTKLPGGQEGFSFLIIITAEFPPIPLAFGFTLNGLGGLLGVRRTMLTDQLRAGIKSNTLEGILFPKIDVKNVGTIVSDLQQVFPISTDERFLIGPMIKIGWGTPSIITAEIGIIIELPNPVQIAIIGIVRLSLPTPAKEIIHLQINFLGVIYFEKKLLSLDAALEDSRILTMTITGQFALRVGWGSTPLFIFSAGGFHPGFKEAPTELQGMERLGIKVFDETNFKLSIDSYFALTTNTVQFGAHAHAIAKLGPFTAVADASFDALIIFNPFAFNVQLQVSGRVTGPLVDAVVEVQASLTGPNRWHIWGHAYAKLVVPIMIPFDTTFGDPIEELASETINVLELLIEEVKKETNWQADTPAYNTSGITLRNLSAVEIGDDIIIHPNTTLSFKQQLVPLGVTIEKFGNKKPVDSAGERSFQKFLLSPGSGLVPGDLLNDLFAPGNFFNLPKDQKLSRPSFEPMQSGSKFTINPTGSQTTNENFKNLDFEVIYIYNDDVQKQPAGTPLPLTDTEMRSLAGGCAAAKSKLSVEKNRPSHQATLKIVQKKPIYRVVRKSDLEAVSVNEKGELVEYGSQAEAYTRLKDFKEEDHIVISNFEL